MNSPDPLPRWDVAKRQAVPLGAFLGMLILMVGLLYWTERQREWRLRQEQATHRLELAYELITRDLQRVASDLLYVASQQTVRSYDGRDEDSRLRVEREFANFLRFKQTCQQIRLIKVDGQETVRAELQGSEVRVLTAPELQDKGERYYVRQALGLGPGELLVSEFDLNQEHGVIEQPWNPVIRFITPVDSQQGDIEYLLVVNYRGGPVLQELAQISLPGQTLLIREDGHYLKGPTMADNWGWLLGHARTFDQQFPAAWKARYETSPECAWTSQGAFAFREIQLQRFAAEQSDSRHPQHHLWLVSYLPADAVFQASRQLLSRLLILGAVMLLPVFLLTRFWAVAASRRTHQNRLIAESATRLRELSSWLVSIQESERRAISREIHDQLGQQVTAISLDLKLAQRELAIAGQGAALQRAIDDTEHLLTTLHDFATRVRPVELDDLGLEEAVESHLQQFQDRTGIDFRLDFDLNQYALPAVVSENVYRLIQECLNNVAKHADASGVAVVVELERLADSHVLQVSVQDDGVGASEAIENLRADGKSPDGKQHLGILGMRERVDLLGGTLEIKSQAGLGTAIRARIPVQDPCRIAANEV